MEDEHKIARALKKALEQDKYAVDVASDGETGLAMAETEPYDLLILDRMLPGINGLDIVRRLRDGKHTMPILILTALGDVPSRTEGLDSGADDYMVKPFAIEELLARVRALLRRPRDQQPSVLEAGDLKVDTITLEAERAGTKVPLTRKEFALLEYLIRNIGRPLSKEKIMSHVWDFNADILPNTIEVYIKSLRTKLDRPLKKPLIKTIRGVGYMLGLDHDKDI